jgi:hypothetical protein
MAATRAFRRQGRAGAVGGPLVAPYLRGGAAAGIVVGGVWDGKAPRAPLSARVNRARRGQTPGALSTRARRRPDSARARDRATGQGASLSPGPAAAALAQEPCARRRDPVPISLRDAENPILPHAQHTHIAKDGRPLVRRALAQGRDDSSLPGRARRPRAPLGRRRPRQVRRRYWSRTPPRIALLRSLSRRARHIVAPRARAGLPSERPRFPRPPARAPLCSDPRASTERGRIGSTRAPIFSRAIRPRVARGAGREVARAEMGGGGGAAEWGGRRRQRSPDRGRCRRRRPP